MRLIERLNPKTILLDAITEKLSGSGVTKIVLVFNVITNKYNIMLGSIDGKSLKLDITENDINMIKRMFINKIKNKFESENNNEIKNIIVQINTDKKIFEVFIEDSKDKMIIFNV